MMPIRLVVLCLSLVLTACCGAAVAQSWPARPVRMLIGLPPGGGSDPLARALAQRLAVVWNQPVIVENRPGANTSVATELVAKAAPDGHTLLFAIDIGLTVNPHLYAKIGYDPLRDFTPITRVAQVPNVVVLNAETAARLQIASLRDLVQYARRNPGRLNYGSGGNGSAGHLAGELFKSQAGLFVVHIPYAGGPAAQLALLSGQVDFTIDNLATASTNIRSGKLKALAVTTAQRSSAMPDLPTVAEAGADLGLRAFDIHTWFGLFGPAQLPAELTQRLNKAFVDALGTPELKSRLASLMAEAAPTTPAQFGDFVRAELAKYEGVVKRSGAKAD